MELNQDDFEYINNFLSKKESEILYKYLVNNIDWQEREIKVFGKVYLQPRLIEWFGDDDYKYSNILFKKKEIPDLIKSLKNRIEDKTNSTFNSVLVNFYRTGNDSMGRHSDDEKELGLNPIITSISLGEERDFIIRSKFDNSKKVINLKSGSLLIMKNNSQKLYSHELPKRKKITRGRVNLTFRKIYG
jgi:alkylated DNA repair dioxygenase AlkB